MAFLTIVAAVIAAFAFHAHTSFTRERNDLMYKHADLSPVTRDQLQNYWAINKAAREQRLVLKITEDVYNGVLGSAAAGKPGYWHAFQSPVTRQHVTDVIYKLRPLFPNCEIEYSSGLNSIGVFWNAPAVVKQNTSYGSATTTVIPASF